VASLRPADLIATGASSAQFKRTVIATRTTRPQPKGVVWELVQPDQFRDIWFLGKLRDEILAKRGRT
jgi:hypothetical protein